MAGLFPNLPGTLVSTFVPTSLLPSSVFPFSLFASSTLPSSASSGSPDSPPSPSPSPPRPDSTQASPDPSSSRPFVLPFALDLDKSHRAAASALSQARRDARDMGVERREGVRKRVKEMEVDAAAVENAQDCDDAGHELRSNGSGSVGASGEEPGIVQAGAQTTVAGSESARKDSAP
ncbi:hypothetical protein B0H34DRAFT_393877 [Crassisporium funariophilum]|nr:hypothetical protein B0H34DRAFT_393877 [Crassisporium funariophilum]